MLNGYGGGERYRVIHLTMLKRNMKDIALFKIGYLNRILTKCFCM